MFTGNNYWKSFLYSYSQSLGDFDTDAYSGIDEYYLYIIWFLSTMVTLIIFFNLLIAIMGDTFDRVQEHAENNMLKELTYIMAENEILFNRSQVFGNAQYIIVIQEEKAEGTKETWEGKLLYLKSIMDKNVNFQKESILKLEDSIEAGMVKNMDELSKSINSNFEKRYADCFSIYKQAKELVQERRAAAISQPQQNEM